MTKPILLLPIVLASVAAAAPAEELRFTFTPVATGGIQKAGYYRVWQTRMTAERPAEVRKEPAYRNAPLYARVSFGDKPGHGVTFVLDEDEKDARFFVDANGNGDLTDDPVPPAERQVTPEERRNVVKIWLYYRFETVVQGGYQAGEPAALGLKFYIYSKADRERNRIEPTLLYYRDYIREGTLTLGGKAYRAALLDDNSDGRYDSGPVQEFRFTGDLLLIDHNASGKFERPLETYSLKEPFSIGGTSYEVAGVSPNGGALTLKRSEKKVAERVAPPTLKAGDEPPDFTIATLAGKELSLRQLRGKLVLLDFWATWCGPCIAELPHVRKVHAEYSPKGLEIVGVSLDAVGDAGKLGAFVKENAMPWLQVHDVKRDVSRKYGVTAIPRTVLIGKDGKVLAVDLRGEALTAAVRSALAP